MPETESTRAPLPPSAPPLRRIAEVAEQCKTCAAFERAARAATALADADAVPASTYFKINGLLQPARVQHMRRYHPDLWAYEQQAELARRQALGIRST